MGNNVNKVKVHSVTYNYVMNTILKMSSFLFPLITFPYVSRVLGVDLNGKIAFSTSYVSYFTMIAQLGIPTYGIRACAKVRDNREKLSKTVQELLLINSFMVVFSYIGLLITAFTIPKVIDNRNLVMLSSISVILTCIGMDWFYQATEQYDYITARNIAFKFISIGLMFLLVHEPEDYIIYAGINVLGTVGSNILNFIRIRKYVSLKFVKGYDLHQHLKPILVFFLFTVSATIYTSLDSVMLGFMSTDKQVGLYAASIKMRNILYSLVTSIGTVLLPRASYLIQNKDFKKFEEIIKKSFQFIAALSIPLTIFFVFEANTTILFLSGNEYADASTAMMIVTPTIFIAGISNITGIQVLIPLGFEKYTVISTFGGAITDLLLNLLFIPQMGAAGAALGTLIAEVVVLFIQLFFMYRENLAQYLKVDWINLLKTIAGGFFAGIALFILNMNITISSNFVRLLITGIVFFSIYLLILAISKEKICWDYGIKTLINIKDKIQKRRSRH